MAAYSGGYYDMLRNLTLRANFNPTEAESTPDKETTSPRDESNQRASPSAADGGVESSSSRLKEQTLLKNALIWIDLEMTGLDLEKDTILEIAIIITDGNLNKEMPGPDLAIHHSDAVLGDMNEWSHEHHGSSGLTDRCRDSATTMQDAEAAAVEFVEQYCDETTSHHLAGSSVHVDLTFLRRHMPALAALLPYRVVDVSTVMELCRRWYPKEYKKGPRKRGCHTALADIQDSIRALRWFRSSIFKKPCG